MNPKFINNLDTQYAGRGALTQQQKDEVKKLKESFEYYRKKKRIAKDTLSKATGISLGVISSFEDVDNIYTPPAYLFCKMMKYIGITIEDLYKDKPAINSNVILGRKQHLNSAQMTYYVISKSLNENEIWVIKERLKERTFQSIADDKDLSRERIRQIYKNAEIKLCKEFGFSISK